MTETQEHSSRTNGIIIGILAAALIVAAFFLLRGCGATTDPILTRTDSLLEQIHRLKVDTAKFGQGARMQNEIIAAQWQRGDSLQKGYDSAKKAIVVKGKELLAINARTKASKTEADTTDYSRHCDSLTNKIDSIAQVAWDYGRKTDSLMFVNDDLKQLQSKQIQSYETQLNKERQSYNGIMQSYAAQHVYDSLLIKRTNKQRAGFAIVGGAAGVILRSIFK